MKVKTFTITGILACVTLTCSIIASESPLTKEFRKRVTPENIDSVNGFRSGFFSREQGTSFFEAAIDADDLGAIKFLLAHGANIEYSGSTGEPPLHYAIRRHRIGIVRTLLNAGADCNANGKQQEKPLHITLKEPDDQILSELLRRHQLQSLILCIGADDAQGNIALHFAALHIGMDPANIQKLIRDTPAGKINAQNENGDTALIIAIRARNEDFVRALLAPREDEAEIDLSLCNTEGNSALHVAAATIAPPVSKGLMDALVARANPEAINKRQAHEPNDTALIIAIRARNEAFARALLRRAEINLSLCNTEGNSPLHIAAAITAPPVSQELIDALVERANAEAINIQQPHEPHNTALIIAIRCNNIGIVQRLLTHPNIEPNFPDATGETPLIIAIEMGRRECIRCLLNHDRINRDTPDRDGNKPADYALLAGLPLRLRDALLTSPSVIYRIEDANRTAEDKAPELGTDLKQLIVRGANLSLTNNNGNTPFHLLAQIASIDQAFLQSLVANAWFSRAIHTFNRCNKLPWDISRNTSQEIKREIKPWLTTRYLLKATNYFSTQPDRQEPVAVRFVVAAAPQPAEQPAQADEEADVQAAGRIARRLAEQAAGPLAGRVAEAGLKKLLPHPQ